MDKHNKFLVADLGGTNIRFGLCAADSTQINAIKKYSIRDYESVKHLLQVYLHDSETNSNEIERCCFAIAGPIHDQAVKMTNCNWQISATAINHALDIKQTVLINDFQAIAYSVTHLLDNGLTNIGDLKLNNSEGPISVFGPGTGLGAALLVPYSGQSTSQQYLVVATEGGHAGLSARSEDELKIFDYWRNKGCRINREFFVCGTGIERIYEAICIDSGSDDYKKRQVANIQQLGCSGNDEKCQKTMNIFCSFLGSAAGDQVLCTGSTGGLVLAGGILPKFVDFLKASPFRQRFESKGAMSGYTKKVATSLIIESQPGLIGAAAYLNQTTIS